MKPRQGSIDEVRIKHCTIDDFERFVCEVEYTVRFAEGDFAVIGVSVRLLKKDYTIEELKKEAINAARNSLTAVLAAYTDGSLH